MRAKRGRSAESSKLRSTNPAEVNLVFLLFMILIIKTAQLQAAVSLWTALELGVLMGAAKKVRSVGTTKSRQPQQTEVLAAHTPTCRKTARRRAVHSLSTVLELGVIMGAALTLAERTKTTAVSTTCTPGTLPTVVLDVLTPTGHHRVPRVVVASLSTVLELGVDMETATTMDLAKISVAGSILSARKQHTMVPPALTATIISSASRVVAVSL